MKDQFFNHTILCILKKEQKRINKAKFIKLAKKVEKIMEKQAKYIEKGNKSI